MADQVRDEVIPELDRLTRERGMLYAALQMLLTAAELQYQGFQISGEYDPSQGKYGQSTATLPNGGKCDRHEYMKTARAFADAALRACEMK